MPAASFEDIFNWGRLPTVNIAPALLCKRALFVWSGQLIAQSPGVVGGGNSGGAITVDWSNGPYQRVTLNAATPVITFANSFMCPHGVLEVYQDVVGGRVPTITGAVYRSGSAPVWSTTLATHDTLEVDYNAVTGKSNVFAKT